MLWNFTLDNMSLRIFALAISLFGILFLFYVLEFSPFLTIDSYESLSSLPENTKVFLEGEVIWNKDFSQGSVFSVKNISVFSSFAEVRAGDVVEIFGVVEEFEGRHSLKALKIKVRKYSVDN